MRAGSPCGRGIFPRCSRASLAGSAGLLAGLLNGSLELVNRAGATVFSAAPSGSRVPVIIAAAAAADGSRLACVAGIDPQFLVLYGTKGATFVETSRTALTAEFRREMRMSFSPDSRWLAVEGDGAVGIVDPVSGRLAWTPLRGALAGIAFPTTPRAAALLSRSGTAWTPDPRGAGFRRAPPVGLPCGAGRAERGGQRGRARRRWQAAVPRAGGDVGMRVDSLRPLVLLACLAAAAGPAARTAEGLDWPVRRPVLTATFGEERTDHFHNGIDLGGGEQDVLAVLPGELVFRAEEEAEYSSLPRGVGSFLVLRHDDGIESVYCHLKKGSVDTRRVRYTASQKVGVMGDTG